MVTVRDLREQAGEKPITVLTAYDAPTAEIIDDADVDVVLVGDSLGNTSLGYETTIPVTVEEMASRVGAVARATEDALVVADMPFLSFGVEFSETAEHAGRLVKEGGAAAVKLESGPHTIETTERLSQLGVPVMAHLGLTPQHVNQYGGYPRQGTDQESAARMLELAQAHAEAGAFSLVLEHVPANLAREITDAIEIPTIGIGAGPDCDGQVLVFDDAVGLSEWSPSFSKQFGDVRSEMERAVEEYATAVRDGSFPAAEHSHEEEDIEDLY